MPLVIFETFCFLLKRETSYFSPKILFVEILTQLIEKLFGKPFEHLNESARFGHV